MQKYKNKKTIHIKPLQNLFSTLKCNNFRFLLYICTWIAEAIFTFWIIKKRFAYHFCDNVGNFHNDDRITKKFSRLA